MELKFLLQDSRVLFLSENGTIGVYVHHFTIIKTFVVHRSGLKWLMGIEKRHL